MVSSAATTVAAYVAGLPAERRRDIAAVRKTIRANLPKGYREEMQFGMIGYVVPLARYPNTYNGAPLMYAALAAQKNHSAVYLHNIYSDPVLRNWFEAAYAKTGKRMDVGKSCVRFRRLEDLPLALIGEAIARTPVDRYIALYEAARTGAARSGATVRRRSPATR
jgi:hypothetical protein